MADINININASGDGEDPGDARDEQLVPGKETFFEKRTRKMRENAVAEGDMIRSTKRWWDKLTKR